MADHFKTYRLLAVPMVLLIIMQGLVSCFPDDYKVDGPAQQVTPAPGPGEKPDDTDPLPDDGASLRLNVVGRYLVDDQGNRVNLHGFGQTYSPFFNENAWGNYDVKACLAYNQRMIDDVLAAGWEMDFIRMHMDPYWSDDPSQPSV